MHASTETAFECARRVEVGFEHTRAHCNKGSRNESKKGREVTRGKEESDGFQQAAATVSPRAVYLPPRAAPLPTWVRDSFCWAGFGPAAAFLAWRSFLASLPAASAAALRGGESKRVSTRSRNFSVAGEAFCRSGKRDSPLSGTDLGLLLTLGLDGGNVGADDTTVGLDGLARPLLGLLLADALLVDAAVDDGPGDLARVLALQEERLLLRRREAVVAVSGTREEKETKVDRAGLTSGGGAKVGGARQVWTGRQSVHLCLRHCQSRATRRRRVPRAKRTGRSSSRCGRRGDPVARVHESLVSTPANNVGGAPCEGERANGPGRGRSCSPRSCRTRPSWLAKVCTKDVT